MRRPVIAYERDDVRRRVYVKVSGETTMDEMIEYINRLANEGVWRYSTLFDSRDGWPNANYERVAAFVRHISTKNHLGERGPVAIVAPLDHQFGFGRMYAQLTEGTGRQTEVFRDVPTAERWLDSCPDAPPALT